MHLCGRCRATFADINEFVNHKKECKKLTLRDDSNKVVELKEVKETNSDLNLATDEAAVISLLGESYASFDRKRVLVKYQSQSVK